MLTVECPSDKTNIKTGNYSGADPGFQVRGAHLKKSRRAEVGAKIVGVFRVKNHDFTQKNRIFSNFRGDPPLLLYKGIMWNTIKSLFFI